jgi:hypothetical protein
MTQYITRWAPLRLAQTFRSLQQGDLKIGNNFQNRANLLALAILQANTPSSPPWAKWRVGFPSRTSGAGLLINVQLVPGYVSPANTVD